MALHAKLDDLHISTWYCARSFTVVDKRDRSYSLNLPAQPCERPFIGHTSSKHKSLHPLKRPHFERPSLQACIIHGIMLSHDASPFVHLSKQGMFVFFKYDFLTMYDKCDKSSTFILRPSTLNLEPLTANLQSPSFAVLLSINVILRASWRRTRVLCTHYE